MNIIAAIDLNYGIGHDGKLLFSIPYDLQNFKKLTLNKLVVMGYNTFVSLPGSKPLRNRTNIILTNKIDLNIKEAIICNSITQLAGHIKHYDSDDVFVIGGQMIYAKLIDYCRYAYITKINAIADADRYFPEIDRRKGWKVINTSAEFLHNDISYSFITYENSEVQSL